MANTKDRIYIDARYHELYKALTESGPFKTMKDVFLLAVAMGFQLGLKVPLDKRHEVFRTAVFAADTDLNFVRAVAVADTHDVAILGDQDQVFSLAEEYANGGNAELYQLYYDQPGDVTDKFVDYLLDVALSA